MSREPIYHTTVRRLSADELREKLSGSPDETARWVYAAAVGGSNTAQVNLGQMLLDGHGMTRDPEAAFRWFTISATAGNVDGINMLGRCYELGWGIAVDLVQALGCYRKAAATAHPWAQFNLAMMMLRDSDDLPVVKAALTLLVRSARQGNAKSMNMIGRYRECGWIGPADVSSAIRWYRRAAERGCFRGAAHLARCMQAEGEIDEAARWYRTSAEIAPVEFCRELAAQLLDAEWPVLQSIGRMALMRAAESEDAADLFSYGHALAHGRGGPIDLEEAAVWLGRAEAKGFPGALDILIYWMTRGVREPSHDRQNGNPSRIWSGRESNLLFARFLRP